MEPLDNWIEHQDVDESRIDEISGYAMLALDQDGVETAGEIKQFLSMIAEELGRDTLQVDQTQQIHYRIDTHLIDQALVYEMSKEDDPDSGGHPRRRYTLTSRGEEWVMIQDWDAAQSLTQLDQTVSEVETDLRDDLDGLQDRIDSLDDSLQSISGQMGGLQSRIDDVESKFEGLEEGHNRLRSITNDHDRDLSELSDQIAGIDSDTDRHDDQIDEIRSSMSDWGSWSQDQIEQQQDSMNQLSDRLKTRTDSLSIRMDELEGEIEDVAEASSQPSQAAKSARQRAARLRYIVITQGVILLGIVAYLAWRGG